MKSPQLSLVLIVVLLTTVMLTSDAAKGKRGKKKQQRSEQADELGSAQSAEDGLQLEHSGLHSGGYPSSRHHYPSSEHHFGSDDDGTEDDNSDFFNDLLKNPQMHHEASGLLPPLPGHRCEEISIDTCRGIGYNVTSMPNFVGHEVISDAKLQLQTFLPLISYGCSSQLKFFLCSVYFPMCTEKVPVMIGPCRPLCESVRGRCAPVLQELGFQWPDALNCSKFAPVNTVDQMCMEGPPPDYIPDPIPGQGPYSRPDFHPSIPEPPPQYEPPKEYPQKPIAPTQDSSTQASVPRLPLKKCHQYRATDRYHFLDSPQLRQQCVPKCDADILFSVENKQFVNYWTAVWSSLGVLSCAFTLITATCASAKGSFRYPERAALYIAACYLVYSATYILRAAVGRQAMSCHQDVSSGSQLLVTESASNLNCQLSFFMLYYFGMAGAAWWLVLSGTWAISVLFRVPATRLAEHRTLYHTIAWVTPALQTLGVIVTRSVDADELTGTCYVGAQDSLALFRFVILPLGLYLGAGVLSIVLAIVLAHLCVIHPRSESCEDCPPPSSSTATSSPGSDLFYTRSNARHHQELSDQSSNHSDQHQHFGNGQMHHAHQGSTGSGASGQPLLQQANFATVSSTASYESSSLHPYNRQNAPNPRASLRYNNRRAQPPPAPTGYRMHWRKSCGQCSSILNPILTNNNQSQKNAAGQVEVDPSALIRAAIFALFYILPASCVLAAHLYEYYCRDRWLLRSAAAVESSGEVSISYLDEQPVAGPNFEIFNMKLFMSLVIGINTGIWILTAKSPLSSWRCALLKCFAKKALGSSVVLGPSQLVSASVAQYKDASAPMQTQLHHMQPLATAGHCNTLTSSHTGSVHQMPTTFHAHRSAAPQRAHHQPQLPPRPHPHQAPINTQKAVMQQYQRNVSPNGFPIPGNAPSDQFFYYSDHQGSLTANFPVPRSNGSTATTTTTISNNELACGFFNSGSGSGQNLVLENPSAGLMGGSQWDMLGAGAQYPPPPPPSHRSSQTGNETAV